MLIIHGRYHLRPTYTAFKNDHCLSCCGERICLEVQTFDVIHIYWIPLVPFGTQKRWLCSTCGQDPYIRTTTRRWVKIAACVFFSIVAVFLGIGAATLWLNNDPQEKEELIKLPVVAIGFAVAAIALGISAAKQDPDRPTGVLNVNDEHDRSRSLVDCPLCGTALMDSPRWHCPNCNVQRL